MVTGVKAGLEPRQMLEVINAGTGRNTATEDKFTKAILPGTFDLGFAAGLMLKDVKLFLAEGESLGVPTDVIEAVARLFQATCDECGADDVGCSYDPGMLAAPSYRGPCLQARTRTHDAACAGAA